MAELDFSKLYKKYRIQFVTKDLSDIGYVNIVAMSESEAINAFLKHARKPGIKVVDCKFIGIIILDGDPSVTLQPLTIKRNSEIVGTYSGQELDVDITVPIKTSELTNDSGFVDSSALDDIAEEVKGMVISEIGDDFISMDDASTNFTDDASTSDDQIPTVGAVVKYTNSCVMSEDQINQIINQYII